MAIIRKTDDRFGPNRDNRQRHCRGSAAGYGTTKE
jgi:hypothetical protein